MSLDTESPMPGITPVIREAKERFKRCKEWESVASNHWLEDYKFAHADDFNQWQWPNNVWRDRETEQRPSLTINKARQHNLQIINDARQHKPGISIRATGGGASVQSARVLEDVVRHIERQSNAQSAYDTATAFQVHAGVGYWRVTTDYAGDQTFDQEIFIRRMIDPLGVYMDPDCKEADKSDAAFAFIFDMVEKKDFKKAYPEYAKLADIGGQTALGEGDEGWITKDKIRVCEYFRKVPREDKLISHVKSDGTRVQLKASALPKDMAKDMVDDPATQWRTISDTVVEWIFIVGEKEVDRKDWPGRYIPIVPVIGSEFIVEGKMDRCGHTRAIRDPQRMYNYWVSSAVEHVALQGKTPWIAPARAIEGYEEYWNNANRRNFSVMPWNDVSDDGNPIQVPARAPAPVMAPAYINGMQIAQQEMMMVSGQYEAQMGQKSNERSGVAIQERQRQGDNATYHFIDNLGVAIRFTGKIILDLIPKIYDTERIMHILAESGETYEITVDPKAKEAFVAQQMKDGMAVKSIFNPNVGKYDVYADMGPAYATKREEAFNAFTLILTQAPQLASIIGDLLLQAGDFPFANDAAERLRRMVPPQALGQGPSQTEQALTQQLMQAKGALAQVMEQLSSKTLQLDGVKASHKVEAFNAISTRLKVLGERQLGMAELKLAVAEALGIVGEEEGEDGKKKKKKPDPSVWPSLWPPDHNEPPVPHARMAPNGEWYAQDPSVNPHFAPVG